MKSPRNRGIWLGALLIVVFLPISLYIFGGGRDQTSIIDRLVSLTGVQTAGLLVYTISVGTRFKSGGAEFGVPFHRWLALSTLSLLLFHVLLAVIADPNNVVVLSLFWAPARGAAATSALICIVLAVGLGKWRRESRMSAKQWRIAHVSLGWAACIFALAHILWIDQLVNDPVWLIAFMGIVLVAFTMWLTKPRNNEVSKTLTGPLPKFAKLLIGAGVVIAVAGVFLLWNNPSAASIGYSQHALGPVGPSDRDMLYKVKQAGLWEMPVGQEAAQRATTVELRDVAQRIADEHHELDELVSETATTLGVQLPNEPSPDQRRWISEISGTGNGIEYDRRAVFLLRAAHGRILPVLAQVRAGTRNAVVRDFADEAMEYVGRHMGYLDSTGLVDFSQLPEAPSPTPYQQPEEASFFDSYDTRTLIVGGLVVAIIATFLAVLVMSLLKDNGKPVRPSPDKATQLLKAKPQGRHRRDES